MGDARPGALEPLSRAVIKSRGLRGSKNEVQMRGGFEARAEVPGGGGVRGRSWEGSLEHPRISPGLGRRSSPGMRDWGALWEGLAGKCPIIGAKFPGGCTAWCLSYGFGVTARMEGLSWHLDRWLVPQQVDPSYGRGTTWQLRLVHQLVVGSGPRIPPAL